MKTEELPTTTESKPKASNEDRLYIGLTCLALVGLAALLFFALY